MKKIFSLFTAILFASSLMATNYIAFEGNTQQASTSIGTSNVSGGSVGVISWTATSASWSSNRVNIAANGSITFTIEEGNRIDSVIINCGSTADYYGTWTATSGTVSGSNPTKVKDINAQSVTVTTSTAFRCTNTKSINIYYTVTEVTKASKPTFSLAEGTYEGTQSVVLSCKTTDATIHYTLDGSEPTTSSAVYSDVIALTESKTIKAFAAKSGLENSEVVSATYVIVPVADVVLDFTDNTNWEFPTDANATEEQTFTNGDYSVKVAGSGYKYYTDASALLVGKKDAYIKLPIFADKAIVRVMTVKESTGSATVTFNIFEGEEAVSTEATSCKDNHFFEIASPKKNTEYAIKITNDNNARFNKIKLWLGEAEPTAIDNTAVEAKAVKTIENGMVIINYNGKRFNVLGQTIR